LSGFLAGRNVLFKYCGMSTVKSFEDLEIWKFSRELVKNIYLDFKNTRDFNFYNQITAVGLSIMNNIAEGFGRESDKEFFYFLNIAKGSAMEVKSMYYVACDLKYLDEKIILKRKDSIQLVVNSISKLKKYLRNK
jgi:four helix bundle protein